MRGKPAFDYDTSVRAARRHGRGDVRVEDVPRPEPGPGQLLSRVSWCGIRGTDVEEYLGGPTMLPVEVPNGLTGRTAPWILGHEFRNLDHGFGAGRWSVLRLLRHLH